MLLFPVVAWARDLHPIFETWGWPELLWVGRKVRDGQEERRGTGDSLIERGLDRN